MAKWRSHEDANQVTTVSSLVGVAIVSAKPYGCFSQLLRMSLRLQGCGATLVRLAASMLVEIVSIREVLSTFNAVELAQTR